MDVFEPKEIVDARHTIARELTEALFEKISGKSMSLADVKQILDDIEYNVEHTPLS